MIKLDLSLACNSCIWVQVALTNLKARFTRKLGKRGYVSLLERVKFEHSKDQRMAKGQRAKVDLEEKSKNLKVDENGDVVMSSELLRSFVYMWDNFLNEINEQSLQEIAGLEIEKTNQTNSDTSSTPFLNAMARVPGLENRIPQTSLGYIPDPISFMRVNDLLNAQKTGFLYATKWPMSIQRHVDAIERFCAQCFPYEGDTRDILLFVALKLHIHGPLGKFIKLFLESRDFMVASHSAKSKSNLSKYLLDGVRSDQGTQTNPHFLENLVHNQSKRLALAKDLACAVICDCSSNNESQMRGLCVLIRWGMALASETLDNDFGCSINSVTNRNMAIDIDHCLAAFCILGESWHVYRKMVRACDVASDGKIKFSADRLVRARRDGLDIGPVPSIMKGGGRATPIQATVARYCMSQPFMTKQGDVYELLANSENPTLVLNLQWDSARMCVDRHAILGLINFVKAVYDKNVDLKSQFFFHDPAMLVHVAMMEGKEEITFMGYLFDFLFTNFDNTQTVDVICGKNEYVGGEGVIYKKFTYARNRNCILCDMYGLEQGRQQKNNIEQTRLVWVHPGIPRIVKASADGKALYEVFNVKTCYCLFCRGKCLELAG